MGRGNDCGPSYRYRYAALQLVPQSKWSKWFDTYGLEESINLNKRMKWYTVIQSIGMVQWYEEQKRYKDMNMWLKFLSEVMNSNLFI